MSIKGNKISFSRQIITLYSGIFLIITASYIVISKNYEKISLQKDKINQIENIKFALYELNFKINQHEITKLDTKASIDKIDLSFNQLINKDSPLYDPTLSDSTNTENILIHRTDDEKRFYDAYRSWKNFIYLLEESFIRNNIYFHRHQELSAEEETKVLLKLTFIRQLISSKLSQIREHNLKKYAEMRNLYSLYFIAITLIDLFYILYMYFFTKKSILTPLNNLVNSSSNIKQGEIKKLNIQSKNEEIKIISSTINDLISEQTDATEYIKQITSKENSLPLQFDKTYAHSQLFISIKEMQDELNAIAKEEKERKWIVEGQAIISEILNRYSNNFEKLTSEIIQHLVKYTNSLQGGLFTVTKDNNDKPIYLELVASYAFDRNKFTSKTIEKGEGILGQVWIENKGMYIENIPEDHMEIKSFVGSTSPKSILIETLIDNKEFYGIIELASLTPLKDYERDFVTRIAENIAATLAAVENNNRTHKLLEESQHMTEKLRNQEEETLQNLQKLKATQEEIKRREIQKENELKAFTEQFNDEIRNHKSIEQKKDSQITQLKKEILLAETDNHVIQSLRKEIEQIKASHSKAIIDMEETIKIKEMRLQKYKKKIDRLQPPNK